MAIVIWNMCPQYWSGLTNLKRANACRTFSATSFSRIQFLVLQPWGRSCEAVAWHLSCCSTCWRHWDEKTMSTKNIDNYLQSYTRPGSRSLIKENIGDVDSSRSAPNAKHAMALSVPAPCEHARDLGTDPRWNRILETWQQIFDKREHWEMRARASRLRILSTL